MRHLDDLPGVTEGKRCPKYRPDLAWHGARLAFGLIQSLCALIPLLLLAGCSGPQTRIAPPDPQTRIETLARAQGLDSLALQGQGFSHRAWFRHGTGDGTRLRVYLEGDGTPWIGRTRIAADPTPREPLALRLMALDPGPALYLGRPCYHGLAREPNCRPWLWTQGRYSEPVAASLAAALTAFADRHGFRRLTLIGYSGGGVLAWLLAERLASAERLVTIAANLDLEAWTARHGYSPLEGSLNPATRPPLPARIAQLHLLGARDTDVPPETARPVLARQPGPPRIRVEDVDHRCCWEPLWAALLPDLMAPEPSP